MYLNRSTLGFNSLVESGHKTFSIKGRVQCFSMQVVMTKCFLLNLKKIGADKTDLRQIFFRI